MGDKILRLTLHLHTLKLKETILNESTDADVEQLAEDRRKNIDCYAELIRLIDDKSLSLIRHEAADEKGRKSPENNEGEIFREMTTRVLPIT